jgi:hypothetical protein
MKTLSLLMALASLSMADPAKAVDDQTFFSGAHLGMTLDECYVYYNEIADGGIAEHSGAPSGERQIDFRTRSDPMRRVYVYVRKLDRKIVSVTYWKMGDNETFSKEEISYLLNFNREHEHGPLISHIYDEHKDTDGTELEITTADQLKREEDQGDHD